MIEAKPIQHAAQIRKLAAIGLTDAAIAALTGWPLKAVREALAQTA